MQGPNVKKLIASRMSAIMIPPGSGKNAVAIGIAALARPGNLVTVAREATAWVEQAIFAVRQAAEPNPWKDATDEEIADEILAKIGERLPESWRR